MAEGNTSRILAVDDSPELLASMSRILRARGHHVYEAQSGADGLRLARKHLPDLMIVDVVLPDMDGVAVCEQVQADEKLSATSVILVSSIRVDSAHRAEGLERGVCEYIARPMPNREFLARVETVLQNKRVLDEAHESRVELERELQAIFSNAPVCLFLADPEARVTRTNPAFERLFPQSSGTAVGQLCGQAFRCAHAHDVPQGCGHGHECRSCVVRNAVRDTVRTGASRVQVKGVLTVGDGPQQEERVVELSTSHVEVRGAPRVIVCLLDVTERTRAQRERAVLQQQLQQAQRMESVGRLAGGVAHDFNNLLSVILGYAFMLDEQLSEEGALREPVEEITSAGLRAKDLTRQLLAFSRRQVLEIKPVDLNEVIRGFAKLVQRLIGEDVALVLDLAAEPLVIQGDPAQLEQVLMNLTVNARDAMPDGGTLTVRTTSQSVDGLQTDARPDLEPGRYGVMRVQDTGCGVPPELLGSIFEPFFTTKEKEKGTGLGLSTTHGIVEQHGGAIELDSEPGVGTTFTLHFPLAEEAASRPIPRPQSSPKSGLQAPIVVVEDDDSVRRLVCRVLERAGYKVTVYSDGAQALEGLRRPGARCDLAVIDLVLPGLNGREVAEALRELHPQARTLFISGYSDDVIHKHGVMEEGLNFVQKPFTVDQLLEKISSLIGD